MELLDSELASMIGESGFKVPGLGVIVYRGGEEIYSKFVGRRAIAPNKPVTRHTRFRAASVSKIFTTFSVLQLAEQNLLDLDADASDYLGFALRNPNCPQKIITPRALANHTSTLRDGKIYSTPPNFSVEEFFKPDGAFWEGGAHFSTHEDYFSYCNLNYGLLGTIIECVTGKRFDLYQRENILRQLETKADYVPANLPPAQFDMLGTLYQKKNPQGVWDEFGAWQPQADDFNGTQPPKDTLALQNPYDENFQRAYDLSDYRSGTNATIFSPQGGLRISFEELAHALELLMNGGTFCGKRILRKSSVEEMLKPQWICDGSNGNTYGGAIHSYGLGVYHIAGNGRNRVCKAFETDLVGHTGEAFGMLSGLFFIPNTRNGFVYMINGTALSVDDPRASGEFSGNYIWEEKIMNAVCEFLFR